MLLKINISLLLLTFLFPLAYTESTTSVSRNSAKSRIASLRQRRGRMPVAAKSVSSPKAPGATNSIVIPFSVVVTGPDGKQRTISGTITEESSVIPPPPPPPPVLAVVSKATDSAGVEINGAIGGSILFIRGSGLGASGQATVAGQAVAVLSWADWGFSCKLPVLTTVQSGPIVVQTATGQIARSTFNFSIFVGSTPPPPPPPPPPVVNFSGYSMNPVLAGQNLILIGSNFSDPSAKATWNGIPLSLVLSGSTSYTTTAPVVTMAISAPILLTHNGVLLTGPNLTINPSGVPPPPPPGTQNVKENGAKGDGTTDDAPAIQALLNRLPTNSSVYFPAGSYLIGIPLKETASNITFLGEGATSRIIHGGHDGLVLGSVTAPISGTIIRKLAFVGLPGKHNSDGNGAAHAILLDAARQTIIEDDTFTGCAHCVYEVNQAVGVTVRRAKVNGYGRVAFGLGDGATIDDCDVVQDYPIGATRSLDYAFYVHNSAKNVLIQNCRVSGTGGYGFHYWAQADVGPGGPITLTGCTFTDCAIGFIAACSPATSGRIQGLTVTNNQWRGAVRGSAVVIRQGDGVTFTGNTIDSTKNSTEMIDCQGLAIGQWSPNEPNGAIRNAKISNNTIKGWDFGIYLLASGGGHFENTVLGPNTTIDCRRPQIADPAIPGLTIQNQLAMQEFPLGSGILWHRDIAGYFQPPIIDGRISYPWSIPGTKFGVDYPIIISE
jgi:hypothetical protein